MLFGGRGRFSCNLSHKCFLGQRIIASRRLLVRLSIRTGGAGPVSDLAVRRVTRRSHSPCDSLRSSTDRRPAAAVPVDPLGACLRLSAWTRKTADRDSWLEPTADSTPSRTPSRNPCASPRTGCPIQALLGWETALLTTPHRPRYSGRKAGAVAPAWHKVRPLPCLVILSGPRTQVKGKSKDLRLFLSELVILPFLPQ
jgi:hypothetical protein